ncbi:hypothetical protein Plo01_53220 [Planobispora longispora]|uniref:Uncharacterized protein n=1 Tax=Planobispora longispora TaxID=28887 RepID=A0A8J3RPS9_9ACTN|nr:hypothetical protein Plo01_53220 [Planobispora longispora]
MKAKNAATHVSAPAINAHAARDIRTGDSASETAVPPGSSSGPSQADGPS